MQQPSQYKELSWLVWVYPTNIFKDINATPRLEIAKEVRKLGWKVDLIASGMDGTQVLQGVDVLCFSTPNVYLFRQLFFHMRIIYYILQNWGRIQVVLFTQISAPWLFPLRLLNPFSKNHPIFVMDTRTVPMETETKATFKDKIRGKFYLFMNRLANFQADGQTAITKRMADLLSIPPNKLWGTWPSGVNVVEFSAGIKERKWPQKDETINIIYIGSLHYERNLMTLCNAIIEANKVGMNYKLLLYGEGTEKKDLQEFANQYPQVIGVFNSVPHGQVPAVLMRAHVGALPFPDEDKYRVSSPIKLFEYMGAGLPILATRIVCHTDVIGNGDYVFWAENSDVNGIFIALQQIWHKRLSLAVMGEKSLNAAVNWTYEASARRLSKALQYGLSLQNKGKLVDVNFQ